MSDSARSPVDAALSRQPAKAPVAAGVPRSRAIGWPKAILIGLVTSALLAALLLYLPHWMLTRLPSLSRGFRVALATGWIGVATAGLLWVGMRFGRAPELQR